MWHYSAVSCAAMLICCGFPTPAHAQSMPWINPDVLSTKAGTDVMSTVLTDRGPVDDQGNSSTSQLGELNGELQKLNQEISSISNALTTSLKAVGESQSTLARKQ
jgi:hypothetical protein